MFDCIQVYTTVLKLPTGERSCSDNISYSKRVKNTIFDYITYRIRKTVSENDRRSLGFPESLCFAMVRWIRVRTIDPHRLGQLFRSARSRCVAPRNGA